MESEKDIKKIREMLEFLVKQKISNQLKSLDKEEKKLYDLTGIENVKKLVEITGFSAGKISGLWREWEQQGIIIKEGKFYRKVV